MTPDRAQPDALQMPVRVPVACTYAVMPSQLLLLLLSSTTASAVDHPTAVQALSQGAFQAVALVGMAVFATTTALLHLFGRRRWMRQESAFVADLASQTARNDRLEKMLMTERQCIISWRAPHEQPLIEGDAGFSAGGSALAFGSWATPQSAQMLERHLETLKLNGEAFSLQLQTKAGETVEATGQAVGGRAVLRLCDVTGVAASLNKATAERDQLSSEQSTLRTLVDSLPHPVWTRNAAGALSWSNAAYLEAVEAPSLAEAEKRKLDLFERAEREAAAARTAAGEAYRAQVQAIVAGKRRVLDVVEQPTIAGRAGIAIDVTDLEEARRSLQRQIDAHAVTLDRLPTAVAIFDQHQALVFRNASFEKLWGFEVAFLDSGPMHGQLLDLQRDSNRVPNLAEYKGWKSEILAAYASTVSSEDWWLLPDGRSIHYLATPNPQGGVTVLFDDVTEGASLKFQVSKLDKVQQETLDALREGVAVFGSDGRLKLSNPAFAEQWRLDQQMLAEAPHIDSIVAVCRVSAPADEHWTDILTAVAGVRDERHDISARFELRNGMILDSTATALPDGGTMITFIDVTDTVNVERALTDKAEALEKAARLRDDFVHKVSYELRSPLTNVIGFAQILGGETTGPLNEKQRDYTSHILRSAGILLAIVNDILDLASIDNGDLALELKPVDIAATITAACEGLADRLNEKSVRIDVQASEDIGDLVADARRVRQVLYNLLANAVTFSNTGQVVTLTSWRDGPDIAFSVVDQGRGIPKDIQDKIFGRFESHGIAAQYRGVGLGLAIVKSLVELHGGRVDLQSQSGVGTNVTCYFPANGMALHEAAE